MNGVWATLLAAVPLAVFGLVCFAYFWLKLWSGRRLVRRVLEQEAARHVGGLVPEQRQPTDPQSWWEFVPEQRKDND